MSEITPKVLEHSAGVLTGATGTTTVIGSYFGWIQFINEYAPAIGIFLTILFGVSHLLMSRYNSKKQDETAKAISENELLRKQLENIGNRETDKAK